MTKRPKPFTAVPERERRTLRIPVLVSADEKAAIEQAAEIRELDTSDWMRRAALGRKADIRFDTKIVLTVSQLVQVIRDAREALSEIMASTSGVSADPIVVAELLAVMKEAVGEAKAALLRIEK